MTTEEKAKAYDKAIEELRGLLEIIHEEKFDIVEEDIIKIFPELKESEDEKIRELLINLANQTWDGADCFKDFSKEKILAWLEKQSTPQVRTGLEWVNTIDDACDKRYAEEYAHGEYCHEQSFKWGFQEGVDWLEKQGESTDINPSEFDLRLNKLLKQFETLPKEELANSLSFYLNVVQNDGTYREENQGEQKLAWREEDETTKNNICHIIRQYDKISKRENKPCWYIGDCLLWMQNIKDRVLPKQELSEEDIVAIDCAVEVLSKDLPSLAASIERLKSLKDRYTWKPSDEEMKALHDLNLTGNISYAGQGQVLIELYNDLLKLKTIEL